LKNYVMPFKEFMQFVNDIGTSDWIPDGFYLAPLAALNPLGYTVWFIDETTFQGLQKGI